MGDDDVGHAASVHCCVCSCTLYSHHPPHSSSSSALSLDCHSTMHVTNHRRLARVERHLVPLPTLTPPLSLNLTHASSTSSPTLSPSSDSSTILANLPRHVVLSPVVRAALLSNSPVVALESTIISHGMPYPQNVQTALSVEAAALALGCQPATIAVLDGIIHVGLTREQFEELGQLGLKCTKCSTRDLGAIVARRGNGSTTVAATMRIAWMCGIRVFATGGVGGVHRGVENTGDVSADLEELARTPVTVVCAGVKSILDIPRTLEYLDTKSVPVLTISASPSAPFPAFFSADSGCPSPVVLPSPAACASVIHHHSQLGLTSGVLIANPIPTEFAAEGQRMEEATQRALAEMREKNVTGSGVTPFLLLRIAELTGGESLAANIQLILNNVRAASLIARELKRLEGSAILSAGASSAVSTSESASPVRVVVCGAVNQDIIGRPAKHTAFLLGTSSPGHIERHLGGVGRNIAEALGRLEHRPLLIAALGADREAEDVVRQCEEVGIRREGFVRLAGLSTSTYLAVMDESNDLFCTITHMDCSDAFLPPLLPALPSSPSVRLFVIDGNLPSDTIAFIAQHAAHHSIPTLFEPVSIEKSARGHQPLLQGLFTLTTPSAAELLAMAERVGYAPPPHKERWAGSKGRDRYLSNEDDDAIRQQAALLLSAIQPAPNHPSRYLHLVCKRGGRGVLLASRRVSGGEGGGGKVEVELREVGTRRLDAIVSTSGAGDTLCGAMVGRLLLNEGRVGDDVEGLVEAIREGMRAAELTLQSHRSVSPQLTRQKLQALAAAPVPSG